MEQATADRLNAAQLTESEHRVLGRFASRLRDALGSDLRALWLYGSRARQTAHPESDVDLLVIADGGRGRYGRTAGDISEAAAIAEGESPFHYSVHGHDPEWLRKAPRDRLLLHPRGRPRQDRPRRERVGLSPRSEEFMQQAGDRLAAEFIAAIDRLSAG